MLRTIMVSAGEPPRVSNDETEIEPLAEGAWQWVDLEAPSKQELALVRRTFDLHPIAIDDCGRFDQRPKIEEYAGHAFVVVHRLRFERTSGEAPDSVELHAFIGERFLLTVRDGPLAELGGVLERLAKDESARGRGPAFAYYLLCDRVMSANFDALDELFDSIEHIEDSVLKQEDDDALPELFLAKRRLAAARRQLSPLRDVLALLSENRFVDERTRIYLRRVLDLVIRMAEAIDMQRDILGNVLDAHLSIVANRTNRIMKSLTLLSAIFLPLGFVTGFFGQNFSHLPFDSPGVMWGGLGLCLLIPTGMLLWFRRQKWL